MIRASRLLRRFLRDDSGATLIEFALVAALLVFLIFGLIDIARLGHVHVSAAKATEMAVRVATVRAPVCANVPKVNRRAAPGILPRNGARCSDHAALCQSPATVACTGAADSATAAAVWDRVRPLLPANATRANLRFSYTYDPELNRLGAAYAPVVTVELVDLDFHFISPLGAMARAAGAQAGRAGQSFRLTSLSASLPSEDLQ